MYISQLALHNIRGFGGEFRLDIADQTGTPRLRTVLIGRNGTCKTTLLRCIALGVCWREDANALLAEPIGPLIAQGEKEAAIEVTLSDPLHRHSSIIIRSFLKREKRRRDYVADQTGRENLKEPLFIWGLGAGRSGEGVDLYRSYQVVDSVYSLFNYEQSALTPVELAIRRLRDYKVGKKPIYRRAMAGIKRTLGLEASARIRLGRGGGVFVSAPSVGSNVPITAWADGYRLTTNWILDAFSWAMRAEAVTLEGGIRGILLVDEVEQHIHPSLHATLLNEISHLFPEAQMFMTTHSPLTTLGASSEELVSLKRTEDGVVRQLDVGDIERWSVLDMVENERTFDASGYGPAAQLSLQRYQTLAKRPPESRSEKEAKELAKLARDLADMRPEKEVSPLLRELMRLSDKFDL